MDFAGSGCSSCPTGLYRCPICKVRYCSSACYKAHKQHMHPVNEVSSCDNKSVDLPTLSRDKVRTLSSTLYLEHEEKICLTDRQLLNVEDEFRKELQDPETGKLLTELLSSDNPIAALKGIVDTINGESLSASGSSLAHSEKFVDLCRRMLHFLHSR